MAECPGQGRICHRVRLGCGRRRRRITRARARLVRVAAPAMAFIDALAALCLNRRDLADGQRHHQTTIWAGRPAQTTYANLGRRQSRPAPRRRRAQPFRGPRGHRQRVRFAAALRRLRQSRKGARATSGPRAAPARFSSGASAVMPKQQADTRCALAAVARRTRGTDVIELKHVAARYDCQSSLPIEASMRGLNAATQTAAKL